MMLTICIPTLYSRAGMLASLLRNLETQCEPYKDQVEILVNADNGELTTGAKRNWLYNNAKGKYVCSVDDDDDVDSEYVSKIVEALQHNPDAVAINGIITTDGEHECKWYISMYNPYKSVVREGRTIYLRFHNHLSPLLKSIAIQFPFPDKTFAEDFSFASAVHKSGLIRSEVVIKKPLYHYKFISKR